MLDFKQFKDLMDSMINGRTGPTESKVKVGTIPQSIFEKLMAYRDKEEQLNFEYEQEAAKLERKYDARKRTEAVPLFDAAWDAIHDYLNHTEEDRADGIKYSVDAKNLNVYRYNSVEDNVFDLDDEEERECH